MKTVVLVVLVVLVVVGVMMYFGSRRKLKCVDYNYNSRNAYKVAIIAGTHGNEPAGTVALEKMIRNRMFDAMNGTTVGVRVIPRVNEWGLKLGTRKTLSLQDVNRNYLVRRGNVEGRESISDNVATLIQDADLIIDLHEGWGFHQLHPTSIGSTLSYSGKLGEFLSQKAVERVNETIHDVKKKFIVLNSEICDIPTTLGCARHTLKKDYILIETTGQNDIQPLSVRTQQHTVLVATILKSILNVEDFVKSYLVNRQF